MTAWEWLALGVFALGFVVAWYVPVWLKHQHVNSQNRLLDRCRALLILGSRAFEADDKAGAEKILSRIRRLEWLWHFGNALPFRISLAVWVVAWGIAACLSVRFLGFSVARYEHFGEVMTAGKFISELPFTVGISVWAPLYALAGYFNNWTNPWAIDNCGDRLWHLMFGPRAVDIAPEEVKIDVPNFDGLTSREVFGLSQRVTRSELDKVRRRLVRDAASRSMASRPARGTQGAGRGAQAG